MTVFLKDQPHQYGLTGVFVHISKLILEMVSYFAYQIDKLDSLVIDK
jgi:hypothetical protein